MAATPDRTRTIGASTSRAMIMMTIISTNPIGDGGGVSGQRGGGRKLKALIVGDGIHFFFLLWNFCGRLEKGEKVMGGFIVLEKRLEDLFCGEWTQVERVDELNGNGLVSDWALESWN